MYLTGVCVWVSTVGVWQRCPRWPSSVYQHVCASFFVSHLENHPMSFLHLSHIGPCNCLICNLISGKGKPVDYPAFIRGENPVCVRARRNQFNTDLTGGNCIFCLYVLNRHFSLPHQRPASLLIAICVHVSERVRVCVRTHLFVCVCL